MARHTSDHLFEVLAKAGIADAVTRRVVIDLQFGHMPVVHVERWGDDKLIEVVAALDGVQITRSEGGQ